MNAIASAVCALLLVAPAQEVEIPAFDPAGMKPHLLSLFRQAQDDVRARPADAAAWSRLGSLFDAHRLYEPAIQSYARAETLEPDSFRHVYLHATIHDYCGKPLEETLALFERAEQLSPDYAPLEMQRGRVLARHGRSEEARAAFERALEGLPDYGAAQLGLGQVLLVLREPELALRHLQAAAREAPEDQSLNAALAQAYARTGARKEARAASVLARKEIAAIEDQDPLRAEVEALRANVHVTLTRAKRHLAAGRFDEAVRDFEIYLSGRPDTPEAQALLGEALWKTGRREQALRHLLRAIELAPDDTETRLVVARMLLRDAKPELDLAETHLREVLARTPNRAEALALQGCLLVDRGRDEASLEAFQRSTVGYSPDAFTYMKWGTALTRLERFAEAVDKLRLAATKQPKTASIHVQLGAVLERLERTDEALRAYRRARQLNPRLQLDDKIRELEAKSPD